MARHEGPARPPREGGDQPEAQKIAHEHGEATPRGRGSTHGVRLPARVSDGHPARAGINPRSRSHPGPSFWPPREGGDQPPEAAMPASFGAATPQGRGSTVYERGPFRFFGGPPREGGDQPGSTVGSRRGCRATPRGRGSTRVGRFPEKSMNVFSPARCTCRIDGRSRRAHCR